MPKHQTISITGKITHVFCHRFVVETSQGSVLADLTPKGAEQHAVRVGEVVTLSGEMKPSELKVSRLAVGKTKIKIEHKKKPHEHHPHAEPNIAMKAARDAGFEPLSQPRRKPKHFEVLGRRNHELTELHVEVVLFYYTILHERFDPLKLAQKLIHEIAKIFFVLQKKHIIAGYLGFLLIVRHRTPLFGMYTNGEQKVLLVYINLPKSACFVAHRNVRRFPIEQFQDDLRSFACKQCVDFIGGSYRPCPVAVSNVLRQRRRRAEKRDGNTNPIGDCTIAHKNPSFNGWDSSPSKASA
jgi:hypothetical protein